MKNEEQNNLLQLTPSVNELWRGIAGHHDSLTQVLCEFIDNAISNFEANSLPLKSILINFEETNNAITVEIHDTGTGIIDLKAALTLGDKSARETPLNEHGFGLKHALASANPENNNWEIYTRTDSNLKDNTYIAIRAPYDFVKDAKRIIAITEPWPGPFNQTGTTIKFKCSKELFNSVQKGIQGAAGFKRCLDYIVEALGYTYAGVIQKGKVTITVTSKKAAFSKTVAAILPTWVGIYQPGEGSAEKDLGGGSLTIKYKFGEMEESGSTRYYKRNQDTSGVEIRVNGRLLIPKVFTEVWGIEIHPSYNHFLCMIDLETNDRNTLPVTRTSKNGIRTGDKKLEKLYEWIRNVHPSPEQRLSSSVSERDMVAKLRDLKLKHIMSQEKRVEMDFEVFNKINCPVKADLYVFDGKMVAVYEAKKDNASAQDFYQLLMYWDGLVADGMSPNIGVLLAATFSSGIDVLIKMFNQKNDAVGNRYSFVKKIWTEEGINYPENSAIRRNRL